MFTLSSNRDGKEGINIVSRPLLYVRPGVRRRYLVLSIRSGGSRDWCVYSWGRKRGRFVSFTRWEEVFLVGVGTVV